MLPSSCDLFHGVGTGAGTFSMFVGSCDNDEQPQAVERRHGVSWSTTSAVDCTLSLGTPSTRSQSHSAGRSTPAPPLDIQQYQRQDYYPLRWDFTSYQPMPLTGSSTATGAVCPAATLGTGASSGLIGGDPVLLARRCANCPKSLCNACGIRYKKERRREASFAVNGRPPSTSLSSPPPVATTQLDPFSSTQSQQQRCEAAAYVYEQYRCDYPATLQAGKERRPSTAVADVGAMEVSLPWWLNVPIPRRAVENYAHAGFLEEYYT